MYSKELVKGTLQTIILKLLREQGRMYGYEICQKVKSLTEGKIEITEGALYPTLHKLEAQGLLSTESILVGGRTRKYYTITQQGGATAELLIQEFSEFMQTMHHLLLSPNL